MAVPHAAPKKPANQGSKAPANVQTPTTTVSGVSNTTGIAHAVSAANGNWQQHLASKQPGGTRGTGKGAH